MVSAAPVAATATADTNTIIGPGEMRWQERHLLPEWGPGARPARCRNGAQLNSTAFPEYHF